MDNSRAIHGCYYGDPTYCEGKLWCCRTCRQTYCEGHYHENEKGKNVECVACEHTRYELMMKGSYDADTNNG